MMSVSLLFSCSWSCCLLVIYLKCFFVVSAYDMCSFFSKCPFICVFMALFVVNIAESENSEIIKNIILEQPLIE